MQRCHSVATAPNACCCCATSRPNPCRTSLALLCSTTHCAGCASARGLLCTAGSLRRVIQVAIHHTCARIPPMAMRAGSCIGMKSWCAASCVCRLIPASSRVPAACLDAGDLRAVSGMSTNSFASSRPSGFSFSKQLSQDAARRSAEGEAAAAQAALPGVRALRSQGTGSSSQGSSTGRNSRFSGRASDSSQGRNQLPVFDSVAVGTDSPLDMRASAPQALRIPSGEKRSQHRAAQASPPRAWIWIARGAPNCPHRHGSQPRAHRQQGQNRSWTPRGGLAAAPLAYCFAWLAIRQRLALTRVRRRRQCHHPGGSCQEGTLLGHLAAAWRLGRRTRPQQQQKPCR